MLRASVFAALGILLVVWATHRVPERSLTREEVVRDLRAFRDHSLPRDRSLEPRERRRVQAFIAAQIGAAHPMSRQELAQVFAEAAAFGGDHRALITIYEAPGTFGSLPVSLWWFPQRASAVLLFVGADIDVRSLNARVAGEIRRAHYGGAQIVARVYRR